MAEIDLFHLDERGLAFVQEHLRDVNTYCSALAARMAGDEGSVFTFAPVGTPDDRLYRFSEGELLARNRDQSRRVKVDGGWLMPVDNLKADQAQMIVEMLRGGPSRSCVVDDFNPEWGDVRRQFDLGETAFGIGKEVYHWFDRRHDRETITLTLNEADTIWHGVSAVAALPSPPSEPPTREWLMEHASTAVAIFCSAYDGEGFVCWRSRRGWRESS